MSTEVGSSSARGAAPDEVVGRVARWRARADRAADRYEVLAQKRPVLGLPLAFLARYAARQGVLLASATAFRLFLWLMPLALLVAGILSGLSRDKTGTVESASKAAGITGAASQEVASALHDGSKSWWIAVLIGSAGVLWGARTLLRSLALISGHVWQVPVRRPNWRGLVVTTLVCTAAFIALVVSAAAIPRLDRLIPGGLILAAVAQMAIAAGVWLTVTMRLPDARTTWRDLLPGCVLFGVSIAVLHAVSRVYIPRKVQHSSELYGALGIAAVILAWLLIIGQVIVGSVLANVVWAEYRQQRSSLALAQPGDTDQFDDEQQHHDDDRKDDDRRQ